jgi:Coenzyme PQQ synthesis protein D (PqqD)
MELSLPDMPFGMGGRRARAAAHPGEFRRQRRRRKRDHQTLTGEVTFGEIVDDLAKTYAAPREKILADVGALLRGLADKTLGIVIKTGQVIGSKVTWRYRVPQWCTSRSACSPS